MQIDERSRRASHRAGYDEVTDTRDYADAAEPCDGPAVADEPNWNDDAEGYGDVRHGRPAAAAPLPKPPKPPTAAPIGHPVAPQLVEDERPALN